MRPRSDTLLVWTGATCSYGCPTCPIDAAAAVPGVQAAELTQRLAGAAADGRLALLVGGEPFLRPDLLRLIAALRAAGYAPGIVTTGRPLVYPQLRERLRRAGLAYLRVQLFGVGEAHDRATGVPGSYAQALAGLRAWTSEAAADCDVDVALNVRGRPLAALPAEVDALARAIEADRAGIVIAIDTPPDAPESPAAAGALAALAGWNDDPSRPLLAWEARPGAPAPAAALRVAPPRPGFAVHASRASCLGASAALARATAVPDGTQANSFNFVRGAATVPYSATAEGCTAYAAGGAVAPERTLWLIEGERLALHVTDTGDFAPGEVVRIKEDLSHLFLDRAAPGVLDDFTEGMRRVLPDAACDACANRLRCGHRFAVVDGPPFARQEAWIAAYVAGLRGRVLDVGCGEQLYRGEIGALLRSGAVQYTGLDPDEPSLALARAALPSGRFALGGIEDYRAEPGSYDHVLCLRSLNHVADLDEAMARMAQALAPGGSLLIVETTPFAMLRRPEQVAAADRAPRAGHQHFRNVASAEVLPFARRRGLDVVEHQPATRENTNEWILVLRRPR